MEKILEELLTEGFDWGRTYNDSPEGIFILNCDHEVVRVNKTMLRMLKLDNYEQLKGKRCYELFHGTSIPPPECVHAKVIHSNHVEETEVIRNGKVYHVVETPIFSKKGRIVGYVHSAYDITEQKEYETKIREEREKFKTIFTQFPIGILVVNLVSGEILDANTYFCEMLNYSKPELTKLTIYDITHPDDLGLSKEHSLKASHDGISYKITKRYVTKFGQIRWVYVSVAPVMDTNNEVSYAFSMIEDITDKVFSQREIDHQKDLLRTYVDLVRIIIVSLDTQGRITMINRRGREILGKQEKELIGKNWFINCVPEREQTRVTQIFQQLISGEISLNGDPPNYFTNPIKIKGGKERLVLWHNTLLRDSDGKIRGILSAGEDVAEQKND
jgi:PAS domain S-box-containing protein